MFPGDCPVPLGEVLMEGFPLGRGRGIQPAYCIPMLRLPLESSKQDESHCSILFSIGAIGGKVPGMFLVISRHPGAHDLQIVMPGSFDLIGVVTQ